MMVTLLGHGAHGLHRRPPSSIPFTINCNLTLNSVVTVTHPLTRRNTFLFTASILTLFHNFNPTSPNPLLSACAREMDEQEESSVVNLFQETSPSVVFIEVLELLNKSSNSKGALLADGSNSKIEGTGSGFLWDKFGHIVTNYHVVAKLATDMSGLQCCKVTVVDAQGYKISTGAEIIGFDPTYDLAVLKFDSQGKELKPALLGTSRDLRVGQNCFAIGNPYGYENTLTTGLKPVSYVALSKKLHLPPSSGSDAW